MTEYVLDTSVAVAWYLPESFSAAAREWQRRLLAGQVSLLVPQLHYWEFANVLRTYVRRGELDEDTAAEVFDVHVDAPLIAAEAQRRTVLQVAFVHEATVYEAVCISIALDRDIGLLTAERSTRPWVVKLGDRVTSVS